MLLLKEDFGVIEGAINSWLDGLYQEMDDNPVGGRAKEIIDESIERAERILARIKTLQEKK